MAPGRPSSASTDGHRVAIPQETIDAIRERTDIVEIVSRYVELRRSGRNLRGLCPFHQEKTPSFYVDPERQMFKCFGCGQGGNVFTFLMEMEGVSFPEAVRTLGRECGVEVSERPGRAQRRELNDRLYAANRFAARFYHDRGASTATSGCTSAWDTRRRRGTRWARRRGARGSPPRTSRPCA